MLNPIGAADKPGAPSPVEAWVARWADTDQREQVAGVYDHFPAELLWAEPPLPERPGRRAGPVLQLLCGPAVEVPAS